MPARLLRSMTVLHTADHEASKAFYQSVGFGILGEWGEPPMAGIYQRGDVTVMLQKTDAPSRAHDGWVAYLYTDDVDALHAEFVVACVQTEGAPQDTYYGCRDFMVIDPNGHRLVFGQDLNEQPYSNGLSPERGRG